MTDILDKEKNCKRSQTATEYLIILAVVVVISLIVVGVLGGIPSIGGGVATNARITQLKNLPIGVSNTRVDCSGAKISLVNNKPDTVQIDFLMLNDTACFPFDPFILNAGEKHTVSCKYIYENKANRNYELPVVINYTDIRTGAKYVQSGNEIALIGRSGDCATDDFVALEEARAAMFEMETEIRNAHMFLSDDPSNHLAFALWKNDSNGNGLLDLSEMLLYWSQPAVGNLVSQHLVFPPENQALDYEVSPSSMNVDMVALLMWWYSPYLEETVLSDKNISCQFIADERPPNREQLEIKMTVGPPGKEMQLQTVVPLD